MADEDVEINRRMGMCGAQIVPQHRWPTSSTHCNTGLLATVNYGTALGVVRAARSRGRKCMCGGRNAALASGRAAVGVGVMRVVSRDDRRHAAGS